MERVTLRLDVHLAPFVGGEVADDTSHLSDHAECVGLHVTEDILRRAGGLLQVAIVHDIVDEAAEVAVLVLQEDQVHNVVGELRGVLVGHGPEVMLHVVEVIIDELEVVGNPLGEALRVGLLRGASGSVKSLVQTGPGLLDEVDGVLNLVESDRNYYFISGVINLCSKIIKC